jgi:hypothetical protein
LFEDVDGISQVVIKEKWNAFGEMYFEMIKSQVWNKNLGFVFTDLFF